MTHTYRQFFSDVLRGLDITPTTANLRALGIVSIIEGVNTYWNPLNSVVPHGKSKPFNKIGVQMYRSYDDGVAGTVALLRGSRWTKVVAVMGTSKTRLPILRAFLKVYATWGSKPKMLTFRRGQAETRLNKIMTGR